MTAPILTRSAREVLLWIRPIAGRLLVLLLATVSHLLLARAGFEVGDTGRQLLELWISLVENQLEIVRSTPP